MQASINERHLKDFVRLLQCASKYGDELCICANKDQWELAVTNSSKSAFCLFKLQPRFFSRYQALGSPSEQRKGVKCSLLVRSVLAVLGKASAASSIERLDLQIHDPVGTLRSRKRSTSQSNGTNGTADTSSIGVTEEDDYQEAPNTRGSYMMVRLVCKHGVTKKHILHLGATDFLRAEVDPDSTPSSFTISARTLRNWLDHFSLSFSSVSSSANPLKSENQLGWMFGQNEVRLKSWEGANKDLCTEIKVDVAEFGADGEGRSRYWVEQERVDLTLPMKEFRATLQLADSLNIDLTVAFSESTQPLTMVYTGGEEDDFDIFCAIATTTCDAFPVDLGKGGAAPPNNGLDSKPRRMISDLTEDGYPKRDGPDDAEGIVKRRRSSETPKSRRGTTQLSMTPGQRAASAQPLVVLESVPPSRNNEKAHSQPNPANSDNAEETGLFLPGGSQEEQSDIPRPDPPPAGSSQRIMTQAEVLEALGMAPGDTVEDLMDDLEDNEDPEFSATQHQPQQDVGDVADWSDGDLLGHQSGFAPPAGDTGIRGEGEFAASEFMSNFYEFPVEDVPTVSGRSKSPVKPPRTPGRISQSFRANPAPSLRGSRPEQGELGSGSRSQLRTLGHGSGSASNKSQQARVRTETQENRDMEEFNEDEEEENGPTPGKKGMGEFPRFFGDDD